MDNARRVVIGVLVIALVFATTSAVAQNNGSCAGPADCYDGWVCDKTGATVNCEGYCGLCYKPPSENSDDTSSTSSDPASAPSNTSQPQGQRPVWVYAVGLVVFVVVLVAVLSWDPNPMVEGFVQPGLDPEPGVGLTFGF